MIFVTVGTQLPFDRLVRAVDAWAALHPEVEVFAQVGPKGFRSGRFASEEFVQPSRANQLMQQAEVIVSHAGMGSVLTALRYQRPILILPRKASLGEHRNEHQLATARWLQSRPGVSVAWEAEDVAQRLDARGELATGPQLGAHASGPLVDRLKAYLKAI